MGRANWFGAGGSVLYISGSLGYLLADILSHVVPDWLYLLLALLFVVDALLYLGEWRADSESAALDVWCWTELVNVLASAVNAVAAGLFLGLPFGDTVLAAQTFLQLQSGLYFTGATLFLLNALMCFSLYRRRERGASLVRDAAWWAEVLNTLPGAGYWATSVVQLVSHLQTVALHDSSPALHQASRDTLRLVRSVNIAFDVMYLVDAVLYGYVWVSEQAPDARSVVSVKMFRPGDYGPL